MNWIKCEERLPKDKQRVLCWEDRFNVFTYDGEPGDDGEGRIRMGDATFCDRLVDWNERTENEKKPWITWENYLECNPGRYSWSGQGPCSFSDVTHWMPLPSKPKGDKDE